MTDPYAQSGSSYVGVPQDYRVLQGYSKGSNTPQNVSQLQNLYAGRMPVSPQPIYGSPQYTYSDLMGLAGKGTQQVLNTQMLLYQLGYLPSFRAGRFDQSTHDALANAMKEANVNGVSLEQLLANSKAGTRAMGAAPGKGGAGSSGAGSGPRTVTQKSVTLTSREGAMSILANALAQELGRQPSQTELTRFTRSLNAHESANPTVTTTHISGSGAMQSSVTKQGNVDTGYEATQFAKSKPLDTERDKYQGSQYMDVIAQMIGAK